MGLIKKKKKPKTTPEMGKKEQEVYKSWVFFLNTNERFIIKKTNLTSVIGVQRNLLKRQLWKFINKYFMIWITVQSNQTSPNMSQKIIRNLLAQFARKYSLHSNT